MTWKLMGNAPMDGTPILAVDFVGDVVACFYSDDEEQWLTFDDFAEPFGPLIWQELEDLPDEDSDFWSQAVEEFEQRCAEDERKWGSMSPRRFPVPVELDDE